MKGLWRGRWCTPPRPPRTRGRRAFEQWGWGRAGRWACQGSWGEPARGEGVGRRRPAERLCAQDGPVCLAEGASPEMCRI